MEYQGELPRGELPRREVLSNNSLQSSRRRHLIGRGINPRYRLGQPIGPIEASTSNPERANTNDRGNTHSEFMMPRFAYPGPMYEGRDEEMLSALSEQIRFEGENASASTHNMRGVILSGLKRYEEAIKAFNEALKINSNDASSLYGKGIALYKLKRYEEAIKTFSKALEIDSEYICALYGKGKVLSKLGHNEEALTAFEEAIKFNSEYAIAHYQRGKVLSNLRKHEKALEAFEKVIEFNPQFAKAHYHKGIALSHLREHKMALEAFEKAIYLDPRNTDARYQRGLELKALMRYREAVEAFEQVIFIKPRDADAYYHKGIAHSHLREHEMALKAFEKAIELKPSHISAHFNKGIALRDLGNRDEEAVKAFEKVIGLNPGNADAYYQMGMVLAKQGKDKEAVNAFENATKFDPSDAYTHYEKGLVLAKQGNDKEALNAFENAIKLDPEHTMAHCQKSIVLYKLGEFQKAEEAFTKGQGQFADANRQLGSVLTRLGRSDEAEAAHVMANKLDSMIGRRDENLAAHGVVPPQKSEVGETSGQSSGSKYTPEKPTTVEKKSEINHGQGRQNYQEQGRLGSSNADDLRQSGNEIQEVDSPNSLPSAVEFRGQQPEVWQSPKRRDSGSHRREENSGDHVRFTCFSHLSSLFRSLGGCRRMWECMAKTERTKQEVYVKGKREDINIERRYVGKKWIKEVASATTIGERRNPNRYMEDPGHNTNEDSCFISKYGAGVFDGVSRSYGVGGSSGGGEASKKATKLFKQKLSEFSKKVRKLKDNQITYELDRMVSKIHDDIKKDSTCGATTLSAVIPIRDGNMMAVNVGDSRVYVLRKDGELEHITLDDGPFKGKFFEVDWKRLLSLYHVEDKVKDKVAVDEKEQLRIQKKIAGMNDREYKKYSDDERFTEKIKNTTDIIEDMKIKFAIHYGNYITQDLGSKDKPIPNIVPFKVNEGEKIIIASDGIYGMLSDPEMTDIIERSKTATEAALALINASRVAERDGHLDDTTAVVMEVGKV